jgi:hypothetical protein
MLAMVEHSPKTMTEGDWLLLGLGTQAQNVQDSVDRGRWLSPERWRALRNRKRLADGRFAPRKEG